MRAIFESLFDLIYLVTVIIIGFKMFTKGKDIKVLRLFGLMALVLGFGDAAHLIPRMYGLLFIGLEANVVALGTGKFITSITMTIFYVMLYHVWFITYEKKKNTHLTLVIYGLAAIRVILCFFPQNEWTLLDASFSWGIYRNIPFLILGLIEILLFVSTAKPANGLSKMWIAIVLSFAFYIPVVLFADTYPMIGMLMIPKTLAYLWIVIMGYKTFGKD